MVAREVLCMGGNTLGNVRRCDFVEGDLGSIMCKYADVRDVQSGGIAERPCFIRSHSKKAMKSFNTADGDVVNKRRDTREVELRRANSRSRCPGKGTKQRENKFQTDYLAIQQHQPT